MKSNDSPEIPDRREISDIPGLPSGELKRRKTNRQKDREKERQKEGTKWIF